MRPFAFQKTANHIAKGRFCIAKGGLSQCVESQIVTQTSHKTQNKQIAAKICFMTAKALLLR